MTSSAVVMRVRTPGGPLTADAEPIAPPRPGQVRIDIAATGVCGADLGTVAAQGGAGLPVTPGHEIAGTVAEIGAGVRGVRRGDRVAVGWFGGSCGHCAFCRRGDVVHCPERTIPGISYRGGWAESITVPADAVARVPDGLPLTAAAPMGCAGVTTFNAVRGAGAPPGGRIAVFGLGGLGHLAVQFAAKMGFDVVAIARGAERAAAARHLGASDYIDSAAAEPGARLARTGGADVIISTVPDASPVPELLTGLRVHGRLVVIGIGAGAMDIPMAGLVMQGRSISGHLTGGPLDIEEAMRFAVRTGVRPVNETLPLESAPQAVDRLRNGRARFRLVLDTTGDRMRSAGAATPHGV